MFFKNFATAAAAATVTVAHLIMVSPTPFTSPSLNNSPLEKDGSNFPCKLSPGGKFVGTPTAYELGAKGEMSFMGSAVHGGGSCQISITYDAQPNKNSVWKVIKSIEGGCPAKSTAGNLGDNASLKNPYRYEFEIPTDIPAGNVTLAWTWLNRIGNREFYMNCAPATLKGKSGAEANYHALPDMVVANIGGSCTTAGMEGSDYKYPNPGKNVDRFPFSSTSLKTLPPACGAPKAGTGTGTGTDPNPAAPSKNPPSPSYGGGKPYESETKPPPATFTPRPAGGTAQLGGLSGSGSVTGGSASGTGSGSKAVARTAGSPCPKDGTWNCVDGSAFQQCASGTWSVVMSLAQGTECVPGESMGIQITEKGVSDKTARSARFRVKV